MALRIRAQLVDEDGQAKSGVTVEACTYDRNGKQVVIGTGRSSSSGNVSIGTRLNVSGHQPRLALRMKSGRSTRQLSQTPSSYTATTANFGKLTVSDQPTMRLARTALFANNMTVERVAQPNAPSSRATATVSPAVTRELRETKSRLADLQRNNNTLNSRLAARAKEIQQVKKEAEKKVQQAVQVKERRIATLESELAAVKRDSKHKTMSVADVVSKTGQQLELARSQLVRNGSPMRLGSVSIQVKGLATEGGGLTFVKPEDMKSGVGEALSTVHATFEANETRQDGGAEETKVAVPDCEGLTRSLTRRRLAAVGLGMAEEEEYVAPVAKGPDPVGRVLRQMPAAGAEVAPGSSVTITFGTR